MVTLTSIITFGSSVAGATALDGITIAGNYFFTEYGNGVDATGVVPGTSTIVQYDLAGNFVHSYAIQGSVDGLKFNPSTGLVWALQNQDGNSTLSFINPTTQTVSAPLSYDNVSASRGYDDVVFKGRDVFLSYTNPNGNGDPTLVKLLNGPNPQPGALLETAPVLAYGSTGLNTVTGKTEAVPQSDPDSIKLLSNGDIVFTSNADGTIIDIQNPGTPQQKVAFTPIQGIPSGSVGSAGLDDVIQPNATSGTFYISDAKNGHVVAIHATGLDPSGYYASVGAFKAFGSVDKTTGAFTPILSASNAPGMTFGSPHGVAFVADTNPSLFGAVTHDVQSAGGEVYALYQAILGRAADPLGLESFAASVASGTPLTNVAQAMLSSSEYASVYGSGPQTSNDAFVNQLYENALGRPADPAGLQSADARLAAGSSRAQVAIDIGLSPEAKADLSPVLQAGVFVPNPTDSSIARLYYGILSRTPDSAGLSGWETFVGQGAGSLQTVAADLLSSPEGAAKTASLGNSAFVDALYQGALGRAPDAAGGQGWIDALNAGTSRATVALGIAESPEASTHLTANIEAGMRLA